MQYTKIVVLAALLGLATYGDQVQAVSLTQQSTLSLEDFNGADEDEIMDKVFSKYSIEGKDGNGVKNGSKILMKSTAPKAAGVILEATHKLKGSQVPGYIKQNFEKAWEKFDINGDGFIKAEETHTFMRSLMGKLNKFALAPGSLSDIGTGADVELDKKPAKKAPVKPKAAPKPAPPKKEEEQLDDAAATTEDSGVDNAEMVDLD